MAQNAVSASQVHKARTSAGPVASEATGRTTARSAVNAVNAWTAVTGAVEVAAAAVAITTVAGATPAAAGADLHLVSGTTSAEVAVDRARAVLASYAKAVASSAMRRATSSETARSTVVVAAQFTVARVATRTEEIDIITEDPSREAALPADTTTTEEAAAADTWAGAWLPHPADTTVDHLSLRIAHVATAATECSMVIQKSHKAGSPRSRKSEVKFKKDTSTD